MRLSVRMKILRGLRRSLKSF
ncbi:hypothetical protein LINPERHAP1_LOCUS14366 [Linum perenne]